MERITNVASTGIADPATKEAKPAEIKTLKRILKVLVPQPGWWKRKSDDRGRNPQIGMI